MRKIQLEFLMSKIIHHLFIASRFFHQKIFIHILIHTFIPKMLHIRETTTKNIKKYGIAMASFESSLSRFSYCKMP